MSRLNFLYKPFDRGGLNHYSIVNHNIKGKLSALNKLACNSDEYWQQYLSKMFRLLIKVLLSTNCKFMHISNVIKKPYVLPVFWKQAFQAWSRVNFKKQEHCTKDTLVLCNSLLSYKVAFNIQTLMSLCNQGIRTFEDFLGKTRSSPVISRVASEIRNIFDITQIANPQPYCDLIIPISSPSIGKFLLSLETEKPQRLWVQWAQDTLRISLDWSAIWAQSKSFISVKLQSFHWHFINRAIGTNVRLCKFNTSVSSLCTFCSQEDETFFHLFWECSRVQQLWAQLIDWCKRHIDPHFNYDCLSCLLTGSPSQPVLNNVFVCCKYLIYIQRFHVKSLYFPNLLRFIKSIRWKDYNAYFNLPYLRKGAVAKFWGNLPSHVFD